MPTLTITKLECIKKRDIIGDDDIDIYVFVDGGAETFLSGPHHLDNTRKNREKDLNEQRTFVEKIGIRLKERNGTRGGFNDLSLSTRWVYAGDRGNTVPFNGNNGGVSYNLTYKLSS
jgi:hypothetical protein